jgi:hypothetical protein
MVILPHDFVVETAEETTPSPEGGDEPSEYTPSPPKGFTISAQPENQDATLILQAGYPPVDGSDNLLDKSLPFKEGLTSYTITVTPEDKESPSKTYHIKVIKVPNLSLSTFQVKRGSDFVRDLALHDTQPVPVSYKGSLEIVAKAFDTKATVSQSPESIPTLSDDPKISTDVTVTVSRNDLDGLPDEYKKKNYNLKLSYTPVELTQLADGGYVNFIQGDDPDSFYEVHTFTESGTLSFINAPTQSIIAGYLIVAGGGGSGGSRSGDFYDYGGGGGAGGLLYKAAETLQLQGGSVAVTVGKGGDGGAVARPGTNGGTSSIGDITVLGGGGGGGGGETGTTANATGKDGGSGGGAAAIGAGNGDIGKASANNGDVLGNNGGKSSGISGGGGGGATGAGGDATDNGTNNNITPGVGGTGWMPSGNTEWIAQVTGSTTEFSRGGTGGVYKGADGVPGANYGDGGSARSSRSASGTDGHSGIVIIRFPHSAPKN